MKLHIFMKKSNVKSGKPPSMGLGSLITLTKNCLLTLRNM